MDPCSGPEGTQQGGLENLSISGNTSAGKLIVLSDGTLPDVIFALKNFFLLTRTSVEFRIKAAIILMKLCFATGVLAIPFALGGVGYGPGSILLVCWGSMTTCGYT